VQQRWESFGSMLWERMGREAICCCHCCWRCAIDTGASPWPQSTIPPLADLCTAYTTRNVLLHDSSLCCTPYPTPIKALPCFTLSHSVAVPIRLASYKAPPPFRPKEISHSMVSFPPPDGPRPRPHRSARAQLPTTTRTLNDDNERYFVCRFATDVRVALGAHGHSPHQR